MKVNWPERVWVNSPVRLLVQMREMRFFKRWGSLIPAARCLEIGCGRGVGIKLIRKGFFPRRVDALDLDPQMVRLASKALRKSSHRPGLCLVADAQYLPYRSACLDAVFNFGIIHHLEDWELGIAEIARVLKPGGVFYFEEIYPPLYANAILRRLLVHPTENRFHGPDFRRALAAAGLRLEPGVRESRFGILGAAVKSR